MPEGELLPGPADFDAQGALTRDYLLRRGTCCGNGCRHCPYDYVSPSIPSARQDTSDRATSQDANEAATATKTSSGARLPKPAFP